MMRRMFLSSWILLFFIFFAIFVQDGLRKDALASTTYFGSFVYSIAFSVPAVGALAAGLYVLRNRFSYAPLFSVGIVALGMFVIGMMYEWYPTWISLIWGIGTALIWFTFSSESLK